MVEMAFKIILNFIKVLAIVAIIKTFNKRWLFFYYIWFNKVKEYIIYIWATQQTVNLIAYTCNSTKEL